MKTKLALRFDALDEHGLSGAGLSRILGKSTSLGPMILRGERKITASHAVCLVCREIQSDGQRAWSWLLRLAAMSAAHDIAAGRRNHAQRFIHQNQFYSTLGHYFGLRADAL